MEKDEAEDLYGWKRKVTTHPIQPKIDYKLIELTPMNEAGILYDASKVFTPEVAEQSIKDIREILAFADPYKKKEPEECQKAI